MRDREEIAAILNQEVRWATERVAEARRVVDGIIIEVPGMLPHPDSRLRLANATKELSHARKALERALDRFTLFTFRGVVPEDLTGSG